MSTLPIRHAALAATLLALGLLAGPSALAQPAKTLAYQGYLEQSGTPLNNTNATLTFRLFRNASGGSALWTETQSGVAVADGLFNVGLGTTTPLAATLFDGSLHLSVAVGGTGATQLAPRTAVRASPYARTLSVPARVVGSPSGDADVLDIENRATSGHGSGVSATSASPNGQGLLGWATATTGDAEGVIGRTEADYGRGVMGLAMAPAGGAIGVSGYAASSNGTGVQGEAAGTNGANYGVRGISRGAGGTGVQGEAAATTGRTYGVSGYASSPHGTGVYGINTSSDVADLYAAGVFGETNATDGWGVVGIAPDDGEGSGVYGRGYEGVTGTTFTPGGAGIVGISAVPGGRAGRFGGDVLVTGVLSKGGGSFEIDHPLDPANRILRHSFVESPDMMNVYNGNVTTDRAGYATVVLPEWFEALNRDFRYQLTVLGQFAQAIVSERVRDNRFVIQTDKPGVEVSWQVTGIRQDAWANENRIVVDEDKPSEGRDRYLHPSAFGLPRERGTHYRPEPEANRPRPEDERARLEADRARMDEERARRAAAAPPSHDQ